MSTPVSGSSSSTAALNSLLGSNAATSSTNAINTLLGVNSGVGTSATSVSFGGLVSGLNIQAIVQAELSGDQQSLTIIQTEQTNEKTKLQAWQDMNTKLQALQTAADTLSLQATAGAKSVTFAGPTGTFATGVANASAPVGSFQLQIDKLATTTKVISTGSIGSPILGTDIVTSSPKVPTAITPGTFTVDGHTVTVNSGDSFNTLLSNIATATTDPVTGVPLVTGSIVGDTIQLTSADGSAIALGSGADSSNFLSVAQLAAQPAASTMTSGPIGAANPTAVLDSANIAGLTSNTSGNIVVNGVVINYNTATDSLNDVMGRINASTAGVTAAYNSKTDTVTLTSTSTGNADISLSDGSGNLLASLNVGTAAAHQLGTSAQYEVNGGPAQYSNSNTVQNLVPGVNVTLQAITPAGPPVLSATVAQDSSVGAAAINTFITAYNSVADTITRDTAFDSVNSIAGVFLGDQTISSIQQQLDQQVFISNGSSLGLTSGYTDLTSIGISTGAIGSAPGTTTDLQFDATKFEAALNANPTAATNLVTTVFGNLSKSLLQMTQPFGVVDSAIQSENSAITDLQTQINDQNQLIQDKTTALNAQFTAMETMLSQLQSQASSGTASLAALNSTSSSSSTTAS